MKRQVAKINIKGFEKPWLILELNSIGILTGWLRDWGKIEIEAPKRIDPEIAILNIPGTEEVPLFIHVKYLGDFQEELEVDSDEVFELQLIEMDEKEIAELPEFEGW